MGGGPRDGRRLHAISRGADPRVLVCGGGPTGLLAGLLLARAVGGSNVRVVDAAAGPSPLTKALVLQVRTVEVLASLGLLEEALRRGRPFEGVTLHSAGNDVPVLRREPEGQAPRQVHKCFNTSSIRNFAKHLLSSRHDQLAPFR